MDKGNSLSYLVPSVGDLLDSKISDENLNVEDGLSSQDDANLFLVASMAFLQRQLKKKLGMNDGEEENVKKGRTYSDMLLFETRNEGNRHRFFIRLKNTEKFDDIKRSETSIPDIVLSENQLLPYAKKPKLRLSRLFRNKSKTSKENKKSGVFGVFKKCPKVEAEKKLNVSEANSPGILMISNNQNTGSSYSLNSEWSKSIKSKCKETKADEQLLDILPTLNSARTRKSFRSNTCLSLDEDEENITPYESEMESVKVKKKSKYYKLKRQQSKLSVCLEDESESENECNNRKPKSKMSYNNFPDELKANLSPEVLQNIITQMIIYLEEKPAPDEETFCD